uniref:ankyrin repeat domain-containing protein 30B-like n=1 Tax=Halichoerus grypus TaxID=9711 RepID=UPI001658C85C|nr:ankyrin repeat domain-containing protein 30B-like [Halichoerus grypus]
MKGPSCLNHIVLIPIQPTVEVKDSVPNKTVELKEKQTSNSDSPKSYPYVKPTVEVKDSVPNKTVELKEKQTSNSGKFYNTNFTVERSTVKYLKCSQCSYSEFFFFFLWQIEGFDINKVDTIVDTHV